MADVEFLASGEADALGIYTEFFENDPGLAEQFSTSLDMVVQELTLFPQSGVNVGRRFRRKLVPWFRNYGVFYVYENPRVVIHAIQDLRQEPSMIERRLRR